MPCLHDYTPTYTLILSLLLLACSARSQDPHRPEHHVEPVSIEISALAHASSPPPHPANPLVLVRYTSPWNPFSFTPHAHYLSIRGRPCKTWQTRNRSIARKTARKNEKKKVKKQSIHHLKQLSRLCFFLSFLDLVGEKQWFRCPFRPTLHSPHKQRHIIQIRCVAYMCVAMSLPMWSFMHLCHLLPFASRSVACVSLCYSICSEIPPLPPRLPLARRHRAPPPQTLPSCPIPSPCACR